MAKLYVFGIGGTGARVLKALTLLLASGVKLGKDIDTLVPILIDPDKGNGDLTRTSELIENYKKIYNKVARDKGFFSTQLRTLQEIAPEEDISNAGLKMLDMSGTQNEKFRDFISYGSMNSTNKDLVNLLFSDSNLKANMEVGFKGNPNIGSVVLNKFKTSQEYKIFLNSFQDGDAIFIISSIFGGTGAAGFPLLLRNLRQGDHNLQNSHLVAKSKIGALSMMPYFSVDDPRSSIQKEIDSNSFMGKAKAALSFYANTIFSGDDQLNAFYTLGESNSKPYDYSDGGNDQKNNAHFLELAAALAVIDFTEEMKAMNMNGNIPNQTMFKEFGTEDSAPNIRFGNLSNSSNEIIKHHLSKFALMTKFNELVCHKEFPLKGPWFDFFEEDYKSDGFQTLLLKKIETEFKNFFEEMRSNDVSFAPFDFGVSYDNLLKIISEHNGVKGTFSKKVKGTEVEGALNSQVKGYSKTGSRESDFIEVFNNGIDAVVEKILKN